MKKVIILVVLFLTVITVPVLVYFIGKKQELRSEAAPATTLALNPGVVNKKLGDIFSLDVQIDTGGNNVAVAELHVTYDTTKLEALSITNGPLAPLIAASGIVGGGTASISVRAESTTKPIKGTGTIAIIRFRAVETTTTPTTVAFDTTTFVSGLGESQPNVLTTTTPATVTIRPNTESVLVATPTATPSASLTPTPTPQQVSTVTIAIPTNDDGVTSTTPIIEGTAEPGSTVTIVIHSDPITATVTVDQNGRWQFTPDVPLTEGTHTIIATVQTPSGKTNTASSEFTVSTSGVGGGGEDMPVSGNSTLTVLLLIFSGTLLLTGIQLYRRTTSL